MKFELKEFEKATNDRLFAVEMQISKSGDSIRE